MKSRRKHAVHSAFLCMTCALGCGDTDPEAAMRPLDAGTPDTSVPAEESLFPWRTGNSWTYRVTDGDEVTTKVHSIGEQEPVGGSGPNKDRTAYRVLTSKVDGADQTISWQAPLGAKIVRYREQSFRRGGPPFELNLEEHWDPYKLRIDSNPESTWLEVYRETKLPVGEEPSTAQTTDRWFVDAESEQVTVPAGTFDAVLFRKVTGGGGEKRYWYVHGVGKVKETGGQTEELMEYDVAQ